jgi:hypothetical protein
MVPAQAGSKEYRQLLEKGRHILQRLASQTGRPSGLDDYPWVDSGAAPPWGQSQSLPLAQ